MNWLETQLDPNRFVRIHRCSIVNVERIKQLQPWFRGDYLVLLNNGPELKMSRSYRDALKERVLARAGAAAENSCATE
jgi:two-component system LytT family response regulator